MSKPSIMPPGIGPLPVVTIGRLPDLAGSAGLCRPSQIDPQAFYVITCVFEDENANRLSGEHYFSGRDILRGIEFRMDGYKLISTSVAPWQSTSPKLQPDSSAS